MKKAKITFIDTADITPGALQPRTEFDDTKIKELADSIKLHGVMQPITIRKRDEVRVVELNGMTLKSERYEIIAGERRWRAAKQLGLRKIPCIISDADNRQAAFMSLTENLQREDLQFFDYAESIRRIQEQFSIPQNELAKRLCTSQSAIANKLRLLKLSGEERSLIREGQLSERHAREFLRVDEPEIRNKIIEKVIKDKLSVNECIKLIDSTLEHEKKPQKKQHCNLKYAFMIKDIKFFMNSVDRSVKLLSQAGVPVEREQQEDGEYLEIKLRIPKAVSSIAVV
ncbi:MAG: hypothetical protein A2Y17_04730 [Clostridiales bacterium GWF2_38_85]|nr:MAG: hypothetical protein A2Y17_04730 [Clostridiales bacterium GWF2_38_85]HBL84407.1 nucleoid occlusion protein [Clostridiales bacterium]